MPRPIEITNDKLNQWNEVIDSDSQLDQSLAQNPIIREVCYAGQYLSDRLKQLQCPEELIGRLMYSAGRLSFGRKDTWEVHQKLYQAYVDGKLDLEINEHELN